MIEAKVTDTVARLINRLKDDKGYEAEMAFLCQAFAEVAKLASSSERYDEDSFTPMAVLARYRDLLDELAQSELADT